MSAQAFERVSQIDAPPERVYAWHARPAAFERLVPPWEQVEVVDRGEGLTDGSRVVIRTKKGPLWLRWVAEHSRVTPGEGFRDRQLEGPFRSWEHEHLFERDGDDTSVVDRVRYELPFGVLGRLGSRSVTTSLERMFAFRHARLRDDLARHPASTRPLRIAISGASGMLGTDLAAFLSTGGHEVLRLVRRPARDGSEVSWDPAAGIVDAARLEGLDAVVHLSGRRIDTRWSAKARRELRESRVDTTRLLAETLATLERKPRVFVSGSAVGFYGDAGDDLLTEERRLGTGFLAELCRDWESAADAARAAGIRVVHPRTAPVLSLRGTPLSRLLLPFRLGLGASLGRGDHWFSWISPDDWVAAILHAVTDDRLSGPVNVAAPEPVPFEAFADTLARVLGRPRFLRVPRRAIELALGDMGRETALVSQRVVPKRLEESGFRFFYPTLESALRHQLGRRT